MEYDQKKGSNSVRLELLPDHVEYEVRDKSGTASFRVPYAALPYRVHEFIERNEWLRNVGLLWTVLGVLITAWRLAEGNFVPSIWVFIGLGCLAWYRFTIVRYSTLQTDEGKIFIIRDRQHDEILQNLLARRVDVLKKQYAFTDHDNDPEQELRKFRWLLDNRVVDEAEYSALKAEIENPPLPSVTEDADSRTIN